MKSRLQLALSTLAIGFLLAACGTRAPSTPLHSAAEKGDLQVVQQHIAAGTDLDAKNSAGWTALHLAAMNGKMPVVQALLTGGADRAVTGPQGKTALDVAREKGQTAVVEHLEALNEKSGRRLIDGGLGVSDALDAF